MKCIFVVFLLSNSAFSQNLTTKYKLLYDNKKYAESLVLINKYLNEFYSKRVDDKRIPAGYTSIQNIGEEVNLIQLFRNRKEKGFFIEENLRISELHYYSGKNLYQLKKYRDSLNHFTQALRFRKLKYKRDDAIFLDISKVFKMLDEPQYNKAYLSSLEQAYTLNPEELKYSLELGLALYPTRFKKKSILHLKKYIDGTSDVFDKNLYLRLASLNEGIGRYLETEKYYILYLAKKTDDVNIIYALGYISYFRTGNYILATENLNKALSMFERKDLDRISKCHEFLGDIYLSNLKYEKSEQQYKLAMVNQEKKIAIIEKLKAKLESIKKKINKMKQDLIYKKDFERYEEYEMLLDDQGRLETELNIMNSQFWKLNPGKVRWNLAEIKNKTENYEDAIKYYRNSIKFDYKSNKARDEIVKLQLKIKRGY